MKILDAREVYIGRAREEPLCKNSLAQDLTEVARLLMLTNPCLIKAVQ
jgi:hypothetical protein